MNTTENNKLIAEFMGLPYNIDKDQYIVPNIGSIEPYLMEYHESWDWLMQVVDKIEELPIGEGGINVRISNRRCTIESVSLGVFHTKQIGNTKIQSTYAAVVEFIIWWKIRY